MATATEQSEFSACLMGTLRLLAERQHYPRSFMVNESMLRICLSDKSESISNQMKTTMSSYPNEVHPIRRKLNITCLMRCI